MRRTGMAKASVAVGVAVALMSSGVAYADNVQNDVVVGGTDTITAGGSTTVKYEIKATGVGNDGQGGCNAEDGSAATLTINAPAAVTVTPASRQFTSCNTSQGFSFSASTAGTYTIMASISDSGVGSYNTTQAQWSLKVNAPAITPAPVVNAAPTFTAPSNVGPLEGNTLGGRKVSYATPTGNDAEDGTLNAVCSPSSGSLFPVGTTPVDCVVTDSGGLTASGSFSVTVVDTTEPALSGMPQNRTLEATGPNGASTTWTAPTASDIVDGAVSASCDKTSGSTFALGENTVTCSATDAAGNKGTASFKVTVVDTTAPTGITFSEGGAQDGGSYLRNFVPAQPTCSATDLVTVSPNCVVTGYSTAAGTHTLTATATDAADNSSSTTISYTVRTLTISAFGSPVDGNNVLNAIKGGSTVPLKFTVFDGVTERRDTAVVKGFSATKVSCDPVAVIDEVEFVTTGSTSLRYDTNQFIQNWKTPTGTGTCYKAIVTTIDGSTQSALFKLK